MRREARRRAESLLGKIVKGWIVVDRIHQDEAASSRWEIECLSCHRLRTARRTELLCGEILKCSCHKRKPDADRMRAKRNGRCGCGRALFKFQPCACQEGVNA